MTQAVSMKWKVSEPVTPIAGQTRTTTHFALWPKRIGAIVVWLAQYETLEAWVTQEIVTDKNAKFTVGQWVVVSSKPVKWIQA